MDAEAKWGGVREYSKQCATLLPLAGGDGGCEGLVGLRREWWMVGEKGVRVRGG